MKVAVILCGHFRTWPEVKHTFPLNSYDVYVSTYTTRYGYHPTVAGSIKIPATVNREVLTEKEVRESLLGVPCRWVEVVPEPPPQHDPEYPVNSDILSQLLTVQRCLDAILASGIQYDLVVRLRLDTVYTGEIVPRVVQPNTVYILSEKEGDSYPDDGYYGGSPEVMAKLLRLLTRKYSDRIINPHTWLGLCLKFFDVRTVNAARRTVRWSSGL